MSGDRTKIRITYNTTDGDAVRRYADPCSIAQYAKANAHLHVVGQLQTDPIRIRHIHRLGALPWWSRRWVCLCDIRI